ncbi:MAG: MerR family transcriptional regulator [Gemmatimonadota bacterium]
MGAEMKVGELAKRTGLTVRTLHHYDEIGLLRPSSRTASGHRLYDEEQLRRLQQITSLRHLGFSLEQVHACLEHPEYALAPVLELHMQRLDRELEHFARLRDLLASVYTRVVEGTVTVDELSQSIEATVNVQKYYSTEQWEQLAERRAEVGEDGMAAAQDAWSRLFEAFAEKMESGVSPADPSVSALVRQSAELVAQFTGGDPGIARSLNHLYEGEGGPRVMAKFGMSLPDGLWDYMGEARVAHGSGTG